MGKETETVYREVGIMFDPQARYVSLVKRGANQIPFRIVKTSKEDSMKVLQAIITKSGTDAEAIKTALGADVADIAKLTAPKEAGGFVAYEQLPKEAFKADTMEVVALTEDKSILGIQGEPVERQEGIMAKLFTPAAKSQVISVSEDADVLDRETLVSHLGPALWDHAAEVNKAMRDILSEEGTAAPEKVEKLKSVFRGFAERVETTMAITKCDCFEQTGAGEETEPKDPGDPPAETPANETDKPEEKNPPLDAEAVAAQAALKAVETLKDLVADQIKPLTDEVAQIRADVAKMQKAPATVVQDRKDDGVSKVSKAQANDDNVFRGIFGPLR